jgi:hypothetical protein
MNSTKKHKKEILKQLESTRMRPNTGSLYHSNETKKLEGRGRMAANKVGTFPKFGK